MTARSETAHRVAETKAWLMIKMAGYLFSQRDTAAIRLVKKLMKADRVPEYSDPELEHPTS